MRVMCLRMQELELKFGFSGWRNPGTVMFTKAPVDTAPVRGVLGVRW